jgi:hypothetical protein
MSPEWWCGLTMEIAFRTKALRTMCLSASALDENFGAEGGATLRRFLADLRAADCFSDVPLLVLSPSSEGLANQAAIDVGVGIRMTVRTNHQRSPLTPDGKIDWPVLDRILIQQINLTYG